MTEREKLKRCVGCEQNFYNGNNPLGVKRCWNLDSAKTVWRVRVPLSQRPPWNQAPVRVFDCRKERGNVLMEPKHRDANNRARAAAMARQQVTP